LHNLSGTGVQPSTQVTNDANDEDDEDDGDDDDNDDDHLETVYQSFPSSLWNEVQMVHSMKNGEVTVVPAARWKDWRTRAYRTRVVAAVEGLGQKLAKEVLLDVDGGY